jgi:hypothetical protein
MILALVVLVAVALSCASSETGGVTGTGGSSGSGATGGGRTPAINDTVDFVDCP